MFYLTCCVNSQVQNKQKEKKTQTFDMNTKNLLGIVVYFLSVSFWCFLQVRDSEITRSIGEKWTKIVSNALVHIHHILWNQKRFVATPQTAIPTSATNSRPFLTAAKVYLMMVYSQVLILCSQVPRRYVVISGKSMQSSRLYFMIDTNLLIMTSVLISFYKGFSSHLRNLYGGRKLTGDLESYMIMQ